MRIEEGKYYRTRDGRKVGPMSRCGVGTWPWGVDGGCDHWDDYCREDGTTWTGKSRIERPNDLISEWTEGPIRTVQRIIPGTYDGVVVGDVRGDMLNVCLWTDRAFAAVPHVLMTATELDRAAAVLTALAGALRDAR